MIKIGLNLIVYRWIEIDLLCKKFYYNQEIDYVYAIKSSKMSFYFNSLIIFEKNSSFHMTFF